MITTHTNGYRSADAHQQPLCVDPTAVLAKQGNMNGQSEVGKLQEDTTDVSSSPLLETHSMLAAMSTLLERLNSRNDPIGLQEPQRASNGQSVLEYGGRSHTSDDLRSEFATAQAREAAACEEVLILRRNLAELEMDAVMDPNERIVEELRDELEDSRNHSRLVEEYAERLQTVVALREGEVSELRSQLQVCRRMESGVHCGHDRSLDSPPSFQTSLCSTQLHAEDSQDTRTSSNAELAELQSLRETLLDGLEKIRYGSDSSRVELQSLKEALLGKLEMTQLHTLREALLGELEKVRSGDGNSLAELQSLKEALLSKLETAQLQSSRENLLDELDNARRSDDFSHVELQGLREALRECRAELYSECEQFTFLRNELSAAVCEISVDGHLSHNGSTSSLPTFRGPESISASARLEALETELSRSLHENVTLEFSVRGLADEAGDAMRQERELHEALLEQSARLRITEASAELQRSRDRELERMSAERHEEAYQEEANAARSLRADLDANMHSIADLSQLVRAGVKEVAGHEHAAAIAEQRARSLQAELYVQNAHVELLRSECRHSRKAEPRDAADYIFEEHVQEVKEIATTFRSELYCVQKAGGAAVRHEMDALSAQRLNEELEVSVANAKKRESSLQSELECRDEELARLKSELERGAARRESSPQRNAVRLSSAPHRENAHREASPVRSTVRLSSASRRDTSPIAVSVMGRSILRATTPPRTPPPAAPAFSGSLSGGVSGSLSGSLGSGSLGVGVGVHRSGSTNASNLQRTATPPRMTNGGTLRLAVRELPVSPALQSRTAAPAPVQSLWQVDSAATAHERLRQRIMDPSSLVHLQNPR